MRRIRQFFWASSLLGLLSIFSAFSYSPGQQKPAAVQAVVGVVQAVSGTAQKLCPHCEGVQKINQQLQALSQSQAADGSTRLNGMTISQGSAPTPQEWVYINGKAYRKTPDNIYTVNGERVYYLDNSNARHAAAPGATVNGSSAAPAGGAGSVAGPQAASAAGQQKSTELQLPSNPLMAYAPAQIGQMLETLKNAKATMEERNDLMKQLDQVDAETVNRRK